MPLKSTLCIWWHVSSFRLNSIIFSLKRWVINLAQIEQLTCEARRSRALLARLSINRALPDLSTMCIYIYIYVRTRLVVNSSFYVLFFPVDFSRSVHFDAPRVVLDLRTSCFVCGTGALFVFLFCPDRSGTEEKDGRTPGVPVWGWELHGKVFWLTQGRALLFCSGCCSGILYYYGRCQRTAALCGWMYKVYFPPFKRPKRIPMQFKIESTWFNSLNIRTN